MKLKSLRIIGSAFILFLILVACEGGGSSMHAGGGIGGSGVHQQGTITGFGSIMVNGEEIDISTAAIIVDGVNLGVGDDAALDNLDIGMVVRVKGSRRAEDKTIVADSVIYNDDIQGPVERIHDVDAITREVIILGQPVMMNPVTVFKGTDFETIAVGDMIEVSGLPDDKGTIWANFVEKTGKFMPGITVEVTGFVKNLNINQNTFAINDLIIWYASADTSDLPGGVPADNLLVEAEGTIDGAGGEMIASRIEPGDELEGDVDEIEIFGFVTDLISGFEFAIGNQLVQVENKAVFVDGEPGDMAPGVKLEAEGRLKDGVLIAHEIEFWEPNQVEVEGIVTEVISESTFTVEDQTIQADIDTVYEDGSPDEIAVGVEVEIKGVPVDIERSIIFADKISFEGN